MKMIKLNASLVSAIVMLVSLQVHAASDPQTGANQFLDRSIEIHAQVEKMAEAMDATYDFRELANEGMLPPVMGTGDVALPRCWDKRCGSESPYTLPIVEAARPLCKISEQGNPCAPFSWRDIVFDGLPTSLSGEITSAADASADAIFQRNMHRLHSTYFGMKLYRSMRIKEASN